MTVPITCSDVLRSHRLWLGPGGAQAPGEAELQSSPGQMQPAQICALHEIEDDRLCGWEELGHRRHGNQAGRRASWLLKGPVSPTPHLEGPARVLS